MKNKGQFIKGQPSWNKNKSPDYMKNNQFAKGHKPVNGFLKNHIPWNKGKKGLHFSPNTEFKKGQRGINWLPLGSETIRIDKGNKKRRWLKIAEPNIWIEYAKFVWMQYNGKIPKGYLIHHIDKNTLNDNIENFALLTRKAHINIHRKDLKI